MLIYCPKCNQGYNLDEKLIPDGGRKLRCGSCGEIFRVDKEDNTQAVEAVSETEVNDFAQISNEAAVESANDKILDSSEEKTEANKVVEEDINRGVVAENTENGAEEDIDVNDIFKRLSEQTINLFEKEKKLTLRERWWLKFKTLTGFNFRIKLKYIIVLVMLVALVSLYNNRYDIARKIPWMASVYDSLGIESQVLGEGLEFQNIDWVYYSEGDAPWMEIKGFIDNSTSRVIELPTVRVEMLDAETNLLKSQNYHLEQDSLNANSRVAINIVVKKPSPTTKYVFLTFVNTEN